MAYRFIGLFFRGAVPDGSALGDGFVLREIDAPFQGWGIKSDKLRADRDLCTQTLAVVGAAEADWIFVDYSTWAGPIDGFQSIGRVAGVDFGPLQGRDETAELAYYEAWAAFGLAADAVRYFPPFERGYWDPPVS